MKGTLKLAVTLLLAAALALAVAACGGDDEGGSTEPGAGGQAGEDIVIGASLSLTGPLGQFGPVIQMGYEKAIAEVNDAGGLDVDGVKHKVRLEILDNKSDPNLASEQARTLLLENEAVALLGSATPPIGIPISQVAEQVKRPFVTSIVPIRAWLTGTQEGWKYSWDMFFDELQMTTLQFLASDRVETNKKVALFTDTEEDGVVMGGLWTDQAPEYGYEIAYHAKFPVGTTSFKDHIQKARQADAEVLIAQMIPPDAIALWKEMKALGYQPAVAYCEKCGNSIAWPQALGEIAEGTMAVNWWTPETGLPRAQEFVDEFAEQLGGISSDLSDVVAAYSAARVLLDAIDRADSLDADPINDEIAATDEEYPIGPVKFEDDHTYAIPVVMSQWRGNDMVLVFPEEGAEEVAAPVPGLE